MVERTQSSSHGMGSLTWPPLIDVLDQISETVFSKVRISLLDPELEDIILELIQVMTVTGALQ